MLVGDVGAIARNAMGPLDIPSIHQPTQEVHPRYMNPTSPDNLTANSIKYMVGEHISPPPPTSHGTPPREPKLDDVAQSQGGVERLTNRFDAARVAIAEKAVKDGPPLVVYNKAGLMDEGYKPHALNLQA